MDTFFPHLFRPLTIKKTTFKNRLFSAPNMMCQLTATGLPNDYMIGYYEAKAKGGVAQVTVGDTPVDEHGVSMPRHPVFSEAGLTTWSELATAIKSHGAIASIELNHGGLDALPQAHPISAVSFIREDGVEVQGMDETLIDETADHYAQAAALAKEMGFDMVLLHGGHGWLLDQFLSPKYNTRKDGYGGSLANRARFPLLVIDRVRKAVGPDFLIEYRMSGSECIEGGLEIEETAEFAKMIQDKVDLIHVSAGLDITEEQAVITHPTIFLPHGVNVKYAAAIKKAVHVPVVTVGAISDPEMAERILAEGKADVVAMTRALISDPEFPNKARTGRSGEIIPCLRCLDCLTGMQTREHFACAVNPWTGREFRLSNTIHPATARKKVLVAGGGPAGMMAAITATERGHEVSLVEKSGILGGLLRFTDYDSLKEDLHRYKDYLIREVKRLKISVTYNTEVTPEYVKKHAPDAVIVALGSEPITPRISGIDLPNVHHATDIYTDLDAVGKKVAIIGGGLVGCETGLSLAESGRQVTIIEMQTLLAPEANWMHRQGLMTAMEKNKVIQAPGLRCTEITSKGVTALDAENKERFIEADTVIYAVGMRPRSIQRDSLRDTAQDVIFVGDCVKARRVPEAINEAYFAVIDLA